MIEILYFDGCPNYEDARDLVDRVVRETGVASEVRLIQVGDEDAARERLFLGSPTIRVDGCDIEPGVEARSNYALSCRVYRSEYGVSGCPDKRWLREALTAVA